MSEQDKHGEWSDPELEARIEAELEPLMSQVEEKAKELGMHGIFIAQVGRLQSKEQDDGSVDIGYRGISRGINTKPFNQLVDDIRSGKVSTPTSDEEAKEFFRNHDTPGPTMMLAMLLGKGDADAESLLAARIAGKALSDAAESGEIDAQLVAQMLSKALGIGIVGPGMTQRKEKVSRAWDLIEDDEGNVLGFRDPETGEEDMLN